MSACCSDCRPLWSEGVRFAPVIDVEGIVEPAQQPVRLLAVDLLSDLHFRDYRYARIETGAKHESLGDYFALFQSDSIILPAPFAKEHDLRIGSRVTINVLGRRAPLVVRGILEAEGPATAFNGNIVICDIATAQRNFNLAGKLSRIDLLVPEEREQRVLSRIALPPGARVERPSRRNERVEKMLRAFRVNLFALAGVALLVGMFLVYNTVLISILRRRRDVGVLKTVGTAPRQIFAAFSRKDSCSVWPARSSASRSASVSPARSCARSDARSTRCTSRRVRKRSRSRPSSSPPASRSARCSRCSPRCSPRSKRRACGRPR
jgi:ABC-type lipoprotein release transport system permease subunit